MKKILMSLLSVYGVANAGCLDGLKPAFNSNSITIEGVENSNKIKISDTSHKLNVKCSVRFDELENFVNKNFIKSSSDKKIVQSWNYLAIDKKPVYDYLKEMKGSEGGYTDATNYKLFGVANNSFACYQHNVDSYYAGSAYPEMGSEYHCAYPRDNSYTINDINITQVISTKDIIAGIVSNPDIAKILKKKKVQVSSITNLKQLHKILRKDDYMRCVISEDGLPKSFAITKLYSNGSIDAVYSLGQDAPHVCQAASPRDTTFTNIKPIMKINSFVKL